MQSIGCNRDVGNSTLLNLGFLDDQEDAMSRPVGAQEDARSLPLSAST